MVIDSRSMPYCPDKLLFAEDLVSYVLTKLFNYPYEGSWATEYREHIFNVFNDDMKVAVWDLVNRLLITNSEFFSELKSASYDAEEFGEFSESLRDCYRDRGDEVALFLLYSAEIAIIAAIYATKGHPSAPDEATAIIIGYFDDDNDMLYGRWKVLQQVASALSSRFPNKDALARLGVISPPRSRQNRRVRWVSNSVGFDFYGCDARQTTSSEASSDLSSLSEGSPDPSRQNELLQPFEDPGNEGRADETEMHETDTKDTFTDDESMEVRDLPNRAVSVTDRASEIITSFEGILERVRGLPRNAQCISETQANSLQKEDNKSSVVRNLFGKCNMPATKEKYYRLSDLLRSSGPSSESTSQDDKAGNTKRDRCSDLKFTRTASDSDSSPDSDSYAKKQKQ